jgi:hypothetical protein
MKLIYVTLLLRHQFKVINIFFTYERLTDRLVKETLENTEYAIKTEQSRGYDNRQGTQNEYK